MQSAIYFVLPVVVSLLSPVCRAESAVDIRHVSHNSEASVGQWMFVSTTVVSVRIVPVVIVAARIDLAPRAASVQCWRGRGRIRRQLDVLLNCQQAWL